MVKLTERQVVDERPRLSSISADVQPTVVAVNEVIRIIGVDIECMVVGMDPAVRENRAKRSATILTHVYHGIKIEQTSFIGRIGIDICVVKRSVSYLIPLKHIPRDPTIRAVVQGR